MGRKGIAELTPKQLWQWHADGVADERAAKIWDCSPSHIRRARQKIGVPTFEKRKLHLSEDGLRDLIYNQKKSDYEIADQYSVNNVTVHNLRKKYGIESLTYCDRRFGEIELTDEEDQIIKGKLLGDAFLFRKTKNASLHFMHSTKQMEYIKHCAEQLPSLFAGKKVKTQVREDKILADGSTYADCYIRSIHHPCLNKYRRMFYREDGTKLFPIDMKITPIILAYWVMDDGSYYHDYKRKHTKFQIATNSFTRDECEYIKYRLQIDFGLEGGSVGKNSNPIDQKSTAGNTVSFGKKQLLLLRPQISPYIHPSLKHKIGL